MRSAMKPSKASSRRTVSLTLPCLLLALGSLSAFCQSARADSGHGIVLDGHATIFVARDQPGPVLLAAKDLASDMQKVFGTAPKIVHNQSDAGPVTIVVGDDLSGAAADHASTPESFSITTGSSASDGGHATKLIRLSGADMRGSLFAIYQFSQQYLGVDPMYYWTDHEPVRRASIHLSDSLHQTYAPPVFRYRGFFINDEDLLTGWASGEAKDHTGISLAVWNKICETVLRLKGNMIVAGTWPFPGEPQDNIVAERGLLLNQHHAEPLGVNFSRWPKDVPYNLTSDPQYIENAWKNAVASYKPDQQILWEIGLRGLSDEPYSALDTSVRGNDHALGHIISKALADQVKLVRARYPDAVFITDLWMEGARLKRQGDLVIPPGVTTVWADTGYGDMQDDGQVTAGQGAYIHVAMYNFVANQLSELTPVDRIFDSLGRFQKAGATAFLLVNTSDIRPVTMGASAVMDFGWTGSSIGSSDDFYRKWSTEEFGPKAAPHIASVYKAYFAAPAVLNGAATRPYGDNYYHTMARELIRRVMVQWPTYGLPGQAPAWTEPRIHDDPYDPTWPQTQAEKEITACAQAQPRWDAVWKQAEAAEPLVAPDRKLFYQGGVLTMITINRESNQMLLSLSRAILALHNGDHAAAVAQTNAALEAVDAIKASEAKAEYGKWKNWYAGDWLTGVDRTHQLLLTFAAFLKNPNVPIPLPVELNNWEAYYHIQHYEGQRTVDVK
jgi:hypothetical protein